MLWPLGGCAGCSCRIDLRTSACLKSRARFRFSAAPGRVSMAGSNPAEVGTTTTSVETDVVVVVVVEDIVDVGTVEVVVVVEESVVVEVVVEVEVLVKVSV